LLNLFRPLFDASSQLLLVLANMMKLSIALELFGQVIVFDGHQSLINVVVQSSGADCLIMQEFPGS
ncbi:hypothetical protein MZ90_09755, partial [Lactobacillus helveticus]